MVSSQKVRPESRLFVSLPASVFRKKRGKLLSSKHVKVLLLDAIMQLQQSRNLSGKPKFSGFKNKIIKLEIWLSAILKSRILKNEGFRKHFNQTYQHHLMFCYLTNLYYGQIVLDAKVQRVAFSEVSPNAPVRFHGSQMSNSKYLRNREKTAQTSLQNSCSSSSKGKLCLISICGQGHYLF